MANSNKGRIFINYRRADSEGYAGRIYDRLAPHFGADAIFMDVDTIEAGVNFVKVLEGAVHSCDVLIVLIGKRWLNIRGEIGDRRLDDPEDFVRIEIAAALKRDIRVIPLLVGGAPMPGEDDLPENLKKLAWRNALDISHHTFQADIQRLITQLEIALEKAEKERKEKEQKAKEQAREEQRKKVAEEKARQAALRKERQQKTAEGIKEFFERMGKLPYYAVAGITLFFLVGYAINNIQLPAKPDPTKELVITLIPDTSESVLPTSTFTLTSTPAPTAIPATPTPILEVGSTRVSEKDGMMMVYVPAGEFEMGSEKYDDEMPMHTVELDAYWIDQVEVTNAMYARCVADGACGEQTRTGSATRGSYYGNPDYDDFPVIYISWDEADTYCEWAGRRLPSEAQWEKAAGWDEDAQEQRLYPWGEEVDNTYANYNYNVSDTTEVGSYKKGMSFYGTYDMAGNVWEWVNDWYDEGYYIHSPVLNPWGPTRSTGYRVVRGGSWSENWTPIRAAERLRASPTYQTYYIGFRCAMDAE